MWWFLITTRLLFSIWLLAVLHLNWICFSTSVSTVNLAWISYSCLFFLFLKDSLLCDSTFYQLLSLHCFDRLLTRIRYNNAWLSAVLSVVYYWINCVQVIISGSLLSQHRQGEQSLVCLHTSCICVKRSEKVEEQKCFDSMDIIWAFQILVFGGKCGPNLLNFTPHDFLKSTSRFKNVCLQYLRNV